MSTPVQLLLGEAQSDAAHLIRQRLAGPDGAPVTVAVAAEPGALLRALAAVDAVALHLGLSGTDDLTLVRRVRAAAPDLPLIVYAASRDSAVGRRALAAGADVFLPRAAVYGALARTLRALGVVPGGRPTLTALRAFLTPLGGAVHRD